MRTKWSCTFHLKFNLNRRNKFKTKRKFACLTPFRHLYHTVLVFADSLQGLSEELLKPYMFMGTEVVYSKLHSSKEEATMTQVRKILRQGDMQANMGGDFVQD